MKKKSLALVLALVLLVGGLVGGTLAWLTATTETVTNTFTVGDINIELSETTGEEYHFVPGDTLAKDPKVTVEADSESCYLFIHVTDANNNINDSENNNKIVNWTVADGWTEVSGHSGYWYREVEAHTGEDQTFAVLADSLTDDGIDGSVTISGKVTKEMVTDLNSKKPSITVVSAAVQQDNVTDVSDAWSKLPTAFTGENS